MIRRPPGSTQRSSAAASDVYKRQIQDRNYVKLEQGRIHPTDLGIKVNELLIRHFTTIMDVEFTAAMEGQLDRIEEGKLNRIDTLKQFYSCLLYKSPSQRDS